MILKNMRIIILLSFIGFLFANCSNNPSRPAPAATQDQIDRVNAESAAAEAQRALSAPVTGSVQHYYCPNNCVGSGGDSQGSCPTCGTAYVHNQAFHNNPATTTTSPINPTANTGTNTSGVFHYTCPSGCAGGSGAMGTCTSCGATLAHNQAFHN